MKTKVLSATVSLLVLAWLGGSFATQSDVTPDPRFTAFVSVPDVSAEHPDSHRLGVQLEEEVALPVWESPADGGEMALLLN